MGWRSRGLFHFRTCLSPVSGSLAHESQRRAQQPSEVGALMNLNTVHLQVTVQVFCQLYDKSCRSTFTTCEFQVASDDYSIEA